jgi:dTDP-4-amino-4,6-dideoxygalactose transaminase
MRKAMPERIVSTNPVSGTYRIPFNRPTRTDRDVEYVGQALASVNISGDGPFTKRCHRFLEQELGVRRALLTTSCTHALEMAAILAGVGGGDEVIVPSFTFVSSVNAFVLRGARPVFADIHPDTLNIDERHVERLLTPRTKAIVVVHYAGVAGEMDAFAEISRRGPLIIEDNAHGLFGRYRNRPLGTFGQMSTLSFHETKNLTCGEGGALLLNDASLIDRAEVIREKGTDRSRFFRGEVDKYSWVDIGSSYLPSDILAAMLAAQLEGHVAIQARRQRLWERYDAALGAASGWADRHGFTLARIPSDREQSFHMFYLLAPSAAARAALLGHLKANGVLAVSHYVPLHASTMGQQLGARLGDCPVTERVADVLVRLPFYTNMTDDEQDVVVGALESFRPST